MQLIWRMTIQTGKKIKISFIN